MAVTFRKTRRRVRKLRRKEKPLRADDLLATAPGDTQGDFGSRSRGRGRRVQEDEEGPGGDPENGPDPPEGTPQAPLPSDDTRTENMDISSDDEAAPPGTPPALEEDEAEQELQQQLERGRRLRQLRELREGGGEKVLELLRGGSGGLPGGPDPRGQHRLQRHLGVLPDTGRDPDLRAGREPRGAGRAHGPGAGRAPGVAPGAAGLGGRGERGLEQREPGRGAAAPGLLSLVHHDPGRGAHREPGPGGVAAALPEQRAVGDHGAEGGASEGPEQIPALGRVLHRGQDVSVPNVTRVSPVSPQCPLSVPNVTCVTSVSPVCLRCRLGVTCIVPCVASSVTRSLPMSPMCPQCPHCVPNVPRAIDDKYSRREEFRGFTQDFKEKDGYRPDVKIEYVDETGRKLTPKEAFRQLSHRFHGKGSGKMKTERRMKKLDEEALLKKMSSSDTPLGTVALLQEKQRAQKTPYIVLSGSGKSMNANTITK
uniref:Uncharacterized protein n=1 Tax=Geospiza parvula TaxID=87175 RepID=A0A8C3NB99_GEOPR